MALRFDGVDDFITFGSDTSIDAFTTFSFAAWYYLDAFTTTAGMRVCGKRNSLNAVDSGVGNAKSWQLFSFWTGNDGQWYSPANSVGTGAWKHLVCTLDGSSTSNDPVFYIDGSAVATTENVAPTGTFESDAASDFTVGNNATPGVRPWDGAIAEVAYFNRVITAAEASILGKGYSPLFIPNGLKVYAPLIGKYSPEINLMGTGNGTITGAVADAHPRITYPSPAIIRRFTTAAAGGTSVKDLIQMGILSFAR